MQLEATQRGIEAVLFASGRAVELEKIAIAFEIDLKTVRNLIDRLRERYSKENSPFDILLMDGWCQMSTLPQYSELIKKVLELGRQNPLSNASLEVLAVIAYNQPVTRAFVEQVRGVDCSYIIRALVEKALVEEAGRLNIPGKPLSYRTTQNFLRSFGLESLEQLPTLPEIQTDQGEEDVELEGQIGFFSEE